ncbi:chemotaxis protein MotA [Candidatus Magnetomoraceae bacterium gMMP-13]
MNIATIIGIVFGMGILSWATFMSTSNVMIFLNLPSLAIVLGGTTAATFICFPLKDVLRVFKLFLIALKREELPMGNYINAVVFLAKQATQKGQIRLEKELSSIENYFLQDGIQMLVDGYSKDEIKNIMDTRIQNTYEQEMAGVNILRTMAKFSPGFGIIGTLIGLISMMQSMGSDLDNLGPAMATALVTTLYGIFLANMFFQPFAIKVEKRVDERIMLMCIIRDGVMFIKDKTPATIVMEKLKAYLPPRKWASIKSTPKVKSKAKAKAKPKASKG